MTDLAGKNLGTGAMFDGVAARYDLLNRVMSFGTDRRWRRELVRQLEVSETHRVLDLATGTADLAIEIAARAPGSIITGVDPSSKMLEIGRRKVSAKGLDARVTLLQGVAEHLEFSDASFDRVCIAFGIRNFPDRPGSLREIHRVTAPGGRLAILELGEPHVGMLAPFARFHVHHVVPRLGALLSGSREYRYLQESIAAFPPPAEFAATMEAAGWKMLRVQPLMYGASNLYVAERAP